MPYIIYGDIGSLTKKIDECAKTQNSSATKIGEQIPCGYQCKHFRNLIT